MIGKVMGMLEVTTKIVVRKKRNARTSYENRSKIRKC